MTFVVNRECIKKARLEPITEDDAYIVLGIVFGWIDDKEREVEAPLADWPSVDHKDLLERIREAGYCACQTPYGCKTCRGDD